MSSKIDIEDVVFWDTETRSTVNLPKTGAYRYAEDPTTDVWCVSWCKGAEGKPKTWFPGDPIPQEIVEHIQSGGWMAAHNAQFELSIEQGVLAPRYGWPSTPVDRILCTAAEAATLGLPRSLDGAARAVGLEVEKDMEGHRLMMRMCRPRRIEKDGTIIWWDDPVKIKRLAEYCEWDCVVDRDLFQRLIRLPQSERSVFILDIGFNRRGLSIDTDLISDANTLMERCKGRINRKLEKVTDRHVVNATDINGIRKWLDEEHNIPTDTLDKHVIRRLLAYPQLDETPRAALELRAEGGKTSASKLKAFTDRVCADGRVRELLLYHGASTGRWAGKGVQFQNLPRPPKGFDAEKMIEAIVADAPVRGKLDATEALTDTPMAWLSGLIRSCIKASPGHDFICADYNAIEARVLAWLAGEEGVLATFRSGGDVYRRMAGQIYGKSPDAIAKDSFERQVGKTAILGLGYQMGHRKFRTTCELQDIDISAADSEHIVSVYRQENSKIRSLWYDVQDAATNAVLSPGEKFAAGRCVYKMVQNYLTCRLPSGRKLYYVAPAYGEYEDYTGEKRTGLTHMGVNSVTNKWERMPTYGGKLVENITQAVARDVLVNGMLKVEAAGYPIVLSVHDEAMSEVEQGFGDLDEYVDLLCDLPAWAAGLPITAEGWRGERYRK